MIKMKDMFFTGLARGKKYSIEMPIQKATRSTSIITLANCKTMRPMKDKMKIPDNRENLITFSKRTNYTKSGTTERRKK